MSLYHFYEFNIREVPNRQTENEATDQREDEEGSGGAKERERGERVRWSEQITLNRRQEPSIAGLTSQTLYFLFKNSFELIFFGAVLVCIFNVHILDMMSHRCNQNTECM